jgi:hypothetical protein
LPSIWCSISGHGFGHAAQVVPVLNEIGRRIPHTTALLNTSVPPSFFQSRLTIPWRLNPVQQDVGCIQHGPLRIDVPATWDAHRRFHADWEGNIRREAAAITRAGPAVVLSDISHFATAAGVAAGIPAVALCSLSWDVVLELYARPGLEEEQAVVRHIRDAYAGAECLIRPTPGIPAKAFPKVIDVGPICEPHDAQPEALRQALQAAESECLVLVGFGGIAQTDLPFSMLDSMAPFRFLVDADVPPGLKRVKSTKHLACPFHTVLASVDVILTKPGYGTITEAVALEKPVVYVRRYHFADEQSLVDYLHRYGRGMELSMDDFLAGRWTDALHTVRRSSCPIEPAPAPTGASEAASILLPYVH